MKKMTDDNSSLSQLACRHATDLVSDIQGSLVSNLLSAT